MSGNRIEIKSLRIENFGCFRDETIRFTSGLNQIIGGNESGKTTILNALLCAIFGVSKNDYPKYRLTLRYIENDLEYELIRTSDANLISLNDSSGVNYDGKEIAQKLNQQFPGGNNLYRAAFCFTPESLKLKGKSVALILDRITAPVFGNFDKPRVEQFIQAEINRIDNQSLDEPGEPGEPGELEMTTEIISNFIKEKNELEDSLAQLEPDLRELEKVRLTQAQLESEIVELEDRFEGVQGYSALNQRMTTLEERLSGHVDHFSRACQLTDDLGRVEKEYARLCIPDEKEADEISIRYDQLEAKADNSKQEMDRLISRRGRANGGFWVATLVLVIVCLISILHASGIITAGLVDPLIPYTLPAVVIVWVIRLVSYIFHYRGKRKATNLFRADLSQFDSYCAEINERFNLKAADPIRAIATTTARHTALESMAANLKKTIGLLTQNGGLSQMKEITKEIKREIGELNGELVPLIKYASEVTRLSEIGEELTARKVRLKSVEEHLAPLVEKCAPARLLNESILGTERELEKLKKRHNDLSHRLEVLKVTRTALKSASSELIDKIYGEFNRDASEMLSELSGRDNCQLRVSANQRGIEVKLENEAGWIGIENLKSRSIFAIVSLALKLVASARIGSFPVLFDEADTGMDDRRFDLWQKQIAILGSNRQIINLSMRPIADIGNLNVINLNNTASQPSVSVLS